MRCMTLEEEVARLAALVDKLESEAKEVVSCFSLDLILSVCGTEKDQFS